MAHIGQKLAFGAAGRLRLILAIWSSPLVFTNSAKEIARSRSTRYSSRYRDTTLNIDPKAM
jgi:hypothetical protein